MPRAPGPQRTPICPRFRFVELAPFFIWSGGGCPTTFFFSLTNQMVSVVEGTTESRFGRKFHSLFFPTNILLAKCILLKIHIPFFLLGNCKFIFRVFLPPPRPGIPPGRSKGGHKYKNDTPHISWPTQLMAHPTHGYPQLVSPHKKNTAEKPH